METNTVAIAGARLDVAKSALVLKLVEMGVDAEHAKRVVDVREVEAKLAFDAAGHPLFSIDAIAYAIATNNPLPEATGAAFFDAIRAGMKKSTTRSAGMPFRERLGMREGAADGRKMGG